MYGVGQMLHFLCVFTFPSQQVLKHLAFMLEFRYKGVRALESAVLDVLQRMPLLDTCCLIRWTDEDADDQRQLRK